MTRLNDNTNLTARAPAATATVDGDHTTRVHDARLTARTFADSLSPAPGPGRTDTLVLVVSELVTNALRHGGGRYTLTLSAGPGTMTASVSDPNPAPPRERAPDLGGAGGGFGWHMVRHLAIAVTISPHSGSNRGSGSGKTIHARLPR
ncbi:ATP-binding protein [Streptomyces sp. NPDC020965]|uniref:ATP-binding protein n=1 Tax=Streptomyces sp. NPDC020965 TaxID=3365105 RepID=UPI0037ABAB5B